MRRIRAGEVTVIDVRPAEEYRAGHIPGALSIPVPELDARLDELPEGRDVVAYCRGPYCVMAVDAVALLRKRGLVAHRLELGVPELRARGLRVTTAVGKVSSAPPGRSRGSGPRPTKPRTASNRTSS
ncbi:MAG: rhodanese-like domain-containing protein [Polyangiaceae bacterium]